MYITFFQETNLKTFKYKPSTRFYRNISDHTLTGVNGRGIKRSGISLSIATAKQ